MSRVQISTVIVGSVIKKKKKTENEKYLKLAIYNYFRNYDMQKQRLRVRTFAFQRLWNLKGQGCAPWTQMAFQPVAFEKKKNVV